MVRQINPSSANPAFDQPSDDLAQRRLIRESNREGKAELPQNQLIPSQPTQNRPASKQPASKQPVLKPSTHSHPAIPKPKQATALPSGLAVQRVIQLKKLWKWQFVWVGVLGLFAGTGLGAYLWLAGLPPLPDCRSITPLSPDANRLYCAQETARSGKLDDLITGIHLVKDWSPSHPLYRNSQQALAKWSRLVMLAARDKIQQNDLKGATEAINQIPATSPAYAEAQKALGEWKTQWQKGEALYAQAIEAMNQQNWKLAFDQVTELGYLDYDYWRLTQADRLSKQISVQKSAQESLQQAKKLATKLNPDEMGAAIELLQAVAPETAAWEESQSLLANWGQALLKIALQHWQDGDEAGAVQMAAQVPMNLEIAADASDLVTFSHAQRLVEENNPAPNSTNPLESAIAGNLVWKQIWSLMESTTAVRQIQPGSPVYAAAQLKLQDWQTQLRDLQQLQFAQTVAGFGQRPALDYAVEQVSQIPTDHSRYGQAQQLAASWNQRIQQLEDLPYLRLAQQFAASQTVSGLQLAIAQARVIPNSRVIWAEAQAQVLAWQQQIERLEDQPLLDQAQNLAKANKLDEAIGKAAEIRPERALYSQAQAAIETWKEKIRATLLAEDQAILDQARNAAGSGDLTEGIATAAQLSPGRPLYLEAQSLIGAWLRERDGDPKQPTADSNSPLAQDSAASVSPETSSEVSSETSSETTPEASSDSSGTSAPPEEAASTEALPDSTAGSTP